MLKVKDRLQARVRGRVRGREGVESLGLGVRIGVRTHLKDGPVCQHMP